jgi:hypothetical protein
MNLCLKKSCSGNFQVVLVPAIMEGQDDVFVVLNFLCVQEVAAVDFGLSIGRFSDSLQN